MTVQVSNNLRSDIDKWISDYVSSGKIPFGHVIICNAQDILMNTKQGYADINSRQPLEDKYLLRIYSMTKPMVATAFMQLLERGMVRLEDELTEYLPEFEETRVFSGHGEPTPRENPITMRQLLTHSAGFTYAWS